MEARSLKKVAVVLLSWNGRHHLETCLSALAAQKDPGVEWEIVVLDNGSTDGTADWMRKTWPRVRLIASPVNLGFCAGNNRLAAEASDPTPWTCSTTTRARSPAGSRPR